jgi:8-oxo-dGTP pyrophosphatase MutT (NUDIX family)
MANHFFGKVSVKILLADVAGDILICKKKDGHYWELPGGRVDENEDLKSAIQRELSEELGIHQDFKKFEIVNSFQQTNPHENILHFYLIVKINLLENFDKIFVLSDEASEISWVNKKNFQDFKFGKFLEKSILENLK